MWRVGASVSPREFVDAVIYSFRAVEPLADAVVYARFRRSRAWNDFRGLLRQAKLPPGARVLCVGCGDALAGRSSVYASAVLLEDYPWAEPELFDIGHARWNFEEGAYQCVVSHSLLHFVYDPLPVCEAIFRVVAPGGLYIMANEPNARFWSNPVCLKELHRVDAEECRRRRWRRYANPARYWSRLVRTVRPRSSPDAVVGINRMLRQKLGLQGDLTDSRRYLAKSVPGQGIVPCALRYSTDPNLAPGIVAGDSFDTGWGVEGNLSVTPDNRVYLMATTNQGRDGIWEVCDGAPRALVVDDETGARGPDIGIATATFVGFDPVYPADDGQFYFFASYRPSPSDTSRTGLFWNDGASNRPLAMNDAANVYGPGWQDATWSSFSTDSLTSAGQWTAFQATIRVPADGATPSGLWRVQAGGTPELVALLDIAGAYGPEANRTWDAFYGNAVLANGDIVVDARTQPGSEYALWLLKRGAPPRRILKDGQNVQVPTSTGTQQAAVTSYTIASGAARYSRGNDVWISADSSMLVEVNLNGYSGRVLITSTPDNPIDKIFADGFQR